MASTNNLVMEKQAQQQAVKCPRCDSLNTKFCYYNNYSLSQPRYFCKCCKRYWTRGGTLRNVPVGGGCRKNKRVKKVVVAGTGAPVDYASSSYTPMITTTTNPSSSCHSRINNINYPLFYGSHNISSSSDHNLSFARFDSALYENIQQSQVNVLGFSAPRVMATTDVSASESIFSNYAATTPIFRSSSHSCISVPTMASLISSNHVPEKSVSTYINDMQMQGINNSSQTRSHQMEATNDLNSLFCVGGWFDSANIGSSPVFDLATTGMS